MSQDQHLGLGTKLVHGGEAPDPLTGAIAPVLVRTKTFQQPVFGVESKWQYSRGKNPTRSILEHKLENLVGAGQATVFGSGDAATAMFLLTLKPGDHIVCCQELYGGTIRLFDQLFADFGIKTSYVDIEDIEAVKKVQTSKTVAIWAESPTNPKLGVIDLDKVGEITRELGLRFIVDLTFAPPCTTDPFACGAETVIYSLSKYFAGHNDVIGGAIVTKNEKLHEKLCWLQWTVGAILSPDECYRVIQELKTLELRWKRVSQTAQTVAEHLQKQSQIKKVYYPGLVDHPGHEIIKKQMKNGFGCALSFDLKSSDLSLIRQFVDRLQNSQLVVFAESLSSPETILAHPASMSHRSLTQKQRDDLGIGDSFFRLSVGFEDPADLIRVIGQALQVFEPVNAPNKAKRELQQA
ncbi:MAG TPA: aminotransferase class I/II-fold pyridoxal phosphate-dependent enzyme [Methylomirabilota bacterium]|nr:aminotransferase class I/II-fold pyridoxal phosphate-dependent enzyme [Methylomirabilota bacterium]